MAQEDSDVEKTEPASQQRIEKSREEGQVPRSRELSTCLILITGSAILWLAGSFLYDRLITVMRKSMSIGWSLRADSGDTREMVVTLARSMVDAVIGLLPLFLGLAVAAIFASVAIGGLVFSTKALQPQFGRMNLIKGIGRMFSANTWIELLKTLAKATLIGTVAALVIMHFMPRMAGLSNLSLPKALATGVDMVAITCISIVASLAAIALIDVPWQMFSHAKKLRMSKEEVKREHKESEGDPMVKGRIRQQQREAARRRMMSQVPTADVVVTNPTHYSVALKYEAGKNKAPVVVAKGQGMIALKIREIAAEHRIPSLEAAPLARALYANAEIGEEIPPVLYAAVAQVLAWVFQLRDARKGLAKDPERPTNIEVPPGLDPHQKMLHKDTGRQAI